MISKNTNKNGVKLLTTIAVVAIALFGMAIIPAIANDTDATVSISHSQPTQWGNGTKMEQDIDSDGIATLSETTQWNLTENITLKSLNLHGKSLKITSKDYDNSKNTKYTVTIENNDATVTLFSSGSNDDNFLVLENVDLIIKDNATKAQNANAISTTGKNGKGFFVVAENSNIEITSERTEKSLWYANNTVMNLTRSSFEVNCPAGLQNIYYKLDESTIKSQAQSEAGIAGYFEITNGSKVTAKNAMIYAMEIEGTEEKESSFEASGIVKVFDRAKKGETEEKIENYWSNSTLTLSTINIGEYASAYAEEWSVTTFGDAVENTKINAIGFSGIGSIAGKATYSVMIKNGSQLNIESGKTFAVDGADVTVAGTLGGNGTVDFSQATSLIMDSNSRIDAANIEINTKAPVTMGAGAEIESYSIANADASAVGLTAEGTPDFTSVSGKEIVVVTGVTENVDVAEAFEKFPGESLILVGKDSNPAVQGDIILQGKKNISLYGLTYTGDVTYGTGNSAKTATFTNVVGNFSLSEGSYDITAEEITSGTITLPDGAVANLDADSINDLTIKMKNGTGSATLNLKIDTLVGDLEICQGITIVQNGVISMMADSSIKNGTSSTLDVKVNGSVTLNGLFGDIAVESGATIGGTITNAEDVSTNGVVVLNENLEAESLNILSGTLTLSKGAVVNNLTIKSEAAATIPAGEELKVDGTGEILGGVRTGDLIVSSGATVTIGEGVTVSSVENNGTLVIKGTVTTLENNKNIRLYGGIQGGTNSGTIIVMDKDATMKNVSGTGSVDMSNVTETKNVSGSISAGQTNVPEYQTVIIDGDLEVKKGAVFTVKGTLVINEGVKVTVETGAELILTGSFAVLENNGELIVNSEENTSNGGFTVGSYSTLKNGGQINLNFTLTSSASSQQGTVMTVEQKANVSNDGSITVGDSSGLTINDDAMFISSGDVTVKGIFSGGISTSGTVVVDSNLLQNDAKIHLTTASATAILNKVVGQVMVDDLGFKYKEKSTDRTQKEANGTQKITLGYAPGAYSASVGGLTVSVATFSEMVDSEKKTYPELVLGGSVVRSFVGNEPTTAAGEGESGVTSIIKATLMVGGPVEVKDSLTIGTYVDVKLDGELKVSGTAVFGQYADLRKNTSDATLVTTGSVTSFIPFLEGGNKVNFVGATYSVKTAATATAAEFTTIHYTSAAAAIAAAGENADIKSVQIYSTTDGTEISSDVTVVKDLTVSIESGEVKIASGKVMTVANGGVLSGTSATVSVAGKLVFENAKTGDKVGSDNITAEVIAAAGDAVTYSSLTTALVDAGEAETVIKLQGNATIEEDTTIPSNVTVQTEGNGIVVKKEKTLTIDGTLYLNTGSIDLTAEKSKVVLNGYLKSDSKVDDTYSGKIAAAYYTTDDSTYHWATGIANAPSVTSVADGAVAIKGDVTVALAFVGTSDKDAEVTIKAAKVSAPITGTYAKITILEGEVTADIEIADSTLTLKNGVTLDTTVKSSAGAIVAEDIKIDADSKFTAKTSDDKVIFSVSGKLADVTTDGADPALSIENDVTLTSFTYAGEISIFGNMTADKTVGLGKTVVDGSVTVANGASLTVADIEILGSLTVAEKESATASLGTFSAKKIYLGIAADDLKKPATTGAAASLTAPEAIDFEVLYVAPGASVSEAIIKDAKSTTYVVDGAPFLTAYGTARINDIAYNTDDAKFESWTDADGKEIEDSKKIGDFETITADLDYNIYKVTIIGDAGVGSVSINGIILNNDGGNRFVSEDIKAGEYKVAVSAKADYDVSKIKLVDADGKDVNMTVVLGGDVHEATYYLSGSVASSADTPSIVIPSQPAEKDDDMGITEYLLIVLVVLAAILVVVVAIRMMRS